MRLLVVSHTEHYRDDNGGVVGWGATVRELSQLARLFDELVHLAPLHDSPAPASALPYADPRVRFEPLRPTGGRRLREKLGAAWAAPAFWQRLSSLAAGADLIHVRAPANVAALAMLRLALRRRPAPWWAKYAGNWRPEPGTDFVSFRLQRRFLARRWPGLAVTVNGAWPNQPSHVRTFDNPCLDASEVATARAATTEKRLDAPLRLLYVGVLSAAKGAGRALDIAARLEARRPGSVQLELIGDGPERPAMESQATRLGLADRAIFHGWQPRPQLGAHYAAAHVLLLPSRSEGWPKVLSEAMAYGTVPVASDVSAIAATLARFGCGRTARTDDLDGFVQAIEGYLEAPDLWRRESEAARAAADAFTYATYLDAVRSLVREAWGLELGGGRTVDNTRSSP
ncbi:MAG: glycosyltransferase [Acidobacteriota bacterium]